MTNHHDVLANKQENRPYIWYLTTVANNGIA